MEKGNKMKECIACKTTKEDNKFPYTVYKDKNEAYRRYNNMCYKCRNFSGEGVTRELVDCRQRLNNKAFINSKPSTYRKAGYNTNLRNSDCAIDEMGLDYDEFENIKDINEL